MIESGGKTAVFVADLIPTTAHVDDAVDHGLRPVSDGHAGVQAARSSREAIEREYLVFFEHDPDDRGRLHPRGGRRKRVEQVDPR